MIQMIQMSCLGIRCTCSSCSLANFLESAPIGSRSGVAKSPEGLAPVRAIFAHGSDEVSIKVSDEGGGNLNFAHFAHGVPIFGFV